MTMFTLMKINKNKIIITEWVRKQTLDLLAKTLRDWRLRTNCWAGRSGGSMSCSGGSKEIRSHKFHPLSLVKVISHYAGSL